MYSRDKTFQEDIDNVLNLNDPFGYLVGNRRSAVQVIINKLGQLKQTKDVLPLLQKWCKKYADTKVCFYDSLLMWSHYADNHKGYVLVYDKESVVSANRFSYDGDAINQKTRLEKVNYVTEQEKNNRVLTVQVEMCA